MLQNFFVPELFKFYMQHNLDPSAFYMMQSGAPSHTTCNAQVDVIDYIRSQFGQQTIGELLGEHWPARSPDLTPCDFFLWSYLKEEVYREGPHTNLAVLESSIRDALQSIPKDFLRRACTSSVLKRMEELRKKRGAHIE